eukprot:g2523.t1
MFARMKALEPRLFEDKHFNDIFRDLPKESLLVPAIYHTQRPDTATICVGVSSSNDSSPSTPPVLSSYEYDFLELLRKDQEGKVVQVVPWESCGIKPAIFWTYSFQPPRGTTSLTPFAAFKLRGVWQGEAVERWTGSPTWHPNSEGNWLIQSSWRASTNCRSKASRGRKEKRSCLCYGQRTPGRATWPRPEPGISTEHPGAQQDAFAASFNRLGEELGQRWSEVNIIPQLQTLAEHKNYLYRITAILSMRALAEVSGRDFIDKHLVPMVVKLTSDPVPNVRFNAAKTILVINQVDVLIAIILGTLMMIANADFFFSHFRIYKIYVVGCGVQTNPLLSAGLWAGGRNQMTKVQLFLRILAQVAGSVIAFAAFGLYYSFRFPGEGPFSHFLGLESACSAAEWHLETEWRHAECDTFVAMGNAAKYHKEH